MGTSGAFGPCRHVWKLFDRTLGLLLWWAHPHNSIFFFYFPFESLMQRSCALTILLCNFFKGKALGYVEWFLCCVLQMVRQIMNLWVRESCLLNNDVLFERRRSGMWSECVPNGREQAHTGEAPWQSSWNQEISAWLQRSLLSVSNRSVICWSVFLSVLLVRPQPETFKKKSNSWIETGALTVRAGFSIWYTVFVSEQLWGTQSKIKNVNFCY